MKPVNCITINTDASFHPKMKVGGYAFYIVCDTFKIQKSGRFKIEPTSSLEAEMMCIANALFCLSTQPNLPQTRLIVINSDCLHAFERIKIKSSHPIGKKIALILRNVRKASSVEGVLMPDFEFRHVKAHSGIKDKRSWVNEWCDTEAKKAMRLSYWEKVKKIKNEQ